MIFAPITWEAAATLATGFAAVGAAYLLGRRQVKISEYQLDILEHQLRLEEVTVKSSLFDRRIDCYEGYRVFLGQVIAKADRVDREFELRMSESMDASRFLFNVEVYERLKETWQLYRTYAALQSDSKAIYQKEGHYGPQLDKIHELLLELTKKFENMHEVFGDELRLGLAIR